MKEICGRCHGTGTYLAELMFEIDSSGRRIYGPMTCRQCKGKGQMDAPSWYDEWRANHFEKKQQMLRHAVDLGGSPGSDESRFFDVKEIRWGAITRVYFRPKRLCQLLNMVFDDDQEMMERAIRYASWSPDTGWRVTPNDGATHAQHTLCDNVRRQLHEQYRIEDQPEFADCWSGKPVDSTEYVSLKLLRAEIQMSRGIVRTLTTWRDSVAAVKARADRPIAA